MSANIPTLFRTYQSHETYTECTIWEAARATSAAPTFFKRIEIGRRQPFIDGGLGRNNPSLLVLEEAKKLFGARQIGCLVSIGTGQGNIISIQKPGLFQRIIPTNVISALRSIATDCEETHEEVLKRFGSLPNTYFRLNVEHGMQGIRLAEWERLGNVRAHTEHYMKKQEVDERLTLLVAAIRDRRRQLTIGQFGMDKELMDLNHCSIFFSQFLPGIHPGLCNVSKGASSVHSQLYHLSDERTFLIRCRDILTQILNLVISLYCMVLVDLGKANLLSNSCKTARSTIGTLQ